MYVYMYMCVCVFYIIFSSTASCTWVHFQVFNAGRRIAPNLNFRPLQRQ